MNQRDLIHKWAHGLNDATSSGAVYVSGGTLVSYGLHFPLGIRCGEKFGKPRFLLNSRDYSATTSKHKSWTRGATGHGECLFVPLFYAPGSYSFLQTAERMMKDFMFAAKQTESNGPRKREEASATCAQLVPAAKALPEFVAGIRTGAGAKVVLSKPTCATSMIGRQPGR